MNRAIRFRAWHNGKKEWLHDSKSPCGGCNILGETIWAFGEWCRVPLEELNDVVVEQYTGLDDKNGVEIYEGDIIEFELEENETIRREVIFCNGYFAYERLDPKYKGVMLHGVNNYSTVIGNIHENSDLLK